MNVNRSKKIVLYIISAVIMLIAIFYFGTRKTHYSDAFILSNQFNQNSHDSTGFGADSARVDSQITLKIPAGHADEVYQYLRDTYINHNTFLTSKFPDKKLVGQDREDVSDFTDQYFDTPDLFLLKANCAIRHRHRINTTDPNDRKSGRELVQMKITPVGKFTHRTELKYPVNKSNVDKPFIGDRIDPEERADFDQAIADLGIVASTLRPVLTIYQQRSRVYINLDDMNILSFSVDVGGAKMLWAEGTFSSVDIGLVENVYTEADEARRQMLWDIREVMIADLKEKFPGLTQNYSEKYSIVFDQLAGQIPFFELLIKNKVL